MHFSEDISLALSLTSIVIGLAAFWPYTKGMLSGKIIPHTFTWLIWALTQSTAVTAMWLDGAGWGALPFTMGTCFAAGVFLYSLRDGNRHITRSDVFVLSLALLGIGLWWFYEDPLWAVVLVTIVDVLGYIPSIRKSYAEPWTENALCWGAFGVSNALALAALQNYTLITMLYLVTVMMMNWSFAVYLLVRRRIVSNTTP